MIDQSGNIKEFLPVFKKGLFEDGMAVKIRFKKTNIPTYGIVCDYIYPTDVVKIKIHNSVVYRIALSDIDPDGTMIERWCDLESALGRLDERLEKSYEDFSVLAKELELHKATILSLGKAVVAAQYERDIECARLRDLLEEESARNNELTSFSKSSKTEHEDSLSKSSQRILNLEKSLNYERDAHSEIVFAHSVKIDSLMKQHNSELNEIIDDRDKVIVNKNKAISVLEKAVLEHDEIISALKDQHNSELNELIEFYTSQDTKHLKAIERPKIIAHMEAIRLNQNWGKL